MAMIYSDSRNQVGMPTGYLGTAGDATPAEQPLPAVQRRLADIHDRLEKATYHAGVAVAHVVGPRPEPANMKSDAPPPAGIMLALDRIESAVSRLENNLRDLC